MNQPIRLSKEAIKGLDDNDVTSILLANEYHKRRCGG